MNRKERKKENRMTPDDLETDWKKRQREKLVKKRKREKSEKLEKPESHKFPVKAREETEPIFDSAERERVCVCVRKKIK